MGAALMSQRLILVREQIADARLELAALIAASVDRDLATRRFHEILNEVAIELNRVVLAAVPAIARNPRVGLDALDRVIRESLSREAGLN
jgi:hypothetical protein